MAASRVQAATMDGCWFNRLLADAADASYGAVTGAIERRVDFRFARQVVPLGHEFPTLAGGRLGRANQEARQALAFAAGIGIPHTNFAAVVLNSVEMAALGDALQHE